MRGLTIRSSRRRFAARLNSGVRCHGKLPADFPLNHTSHAGRAASWKHDWRTRARLLYSIWQEPILFRLCSIMGNRNVFSHVCRFLRHTSCPYLWRTILRLSIQVRPRKLRYILDCRYSPRTGPADSSTRSRRHVPWLRCSSGILHSLPCQTSPEIASSWHLTIRSSRPSFAAAMC